MTDLDFISIKTKALKSGTIEVYPDFLVHETRDLMVRGGDFYAVWDQAKGLWSTSEYDLRRIVDEALLAASKKVKSETTSDVTVRTMHSFESRSWTQFLQYIRQLPDNYNPLDKRVVFSGEEVGRNDFASMKLNYPLAPGPKDSYEELISTLYEPSEREKIEWGIGAIVSGDALKFQKFFVLYGRGGSGKGTVLDILAELFDGYTQTFTAKQLASANNAFALSEFKNDPVVAIDYDADLSRIEDNTYLNKIAARELVVVNEKFKSPYSMRIHSMLFMGTNSPVRITDSKSGIIRRLIDISPSGNRVPTDRYYELKNKIKFELSGIAYHCLKVYRELGESYYEKYIPTSMLEKTNVFYNFVDEYQLEFKNGISLKRAYDLYKQYCVEAIIQHPLPKHKFKDEFSNYFDEVRDISRSVEGSRERNVYFGFRFPSSLDEGTDDKSNIEESTEDWLYLAEQPSILDEILKDCPAQYANEHETPQKDWEHVSTTLKDIDTKGIHYVRPPVNHIVIDFDLTDSLGNKSLERNREAARNWPSTYAEVSKSGKGLHLHYIWEGDPSTLRRTFDEGIEVKVFNGKASLRRKLGLCNGIRPASIKSGLPLKAVKPVLDVDRAMTEKGMRELVLKNLRKEIHASTKPSVDFIAKVFKDAQDSGLVYDLTDLRPRIVAFAANSTHQSENCIKTVSQIKFKSEERASDKGFCSDDPIVFFDVEVFPNLFVVVWKPQGDLGNPVKMINPTPKEIEKLFSMKLVGFNNRRYDNHILYARYMGYSNEQLFKLSDRMITQEKRDAYFSEAYSVSYTDVFDFSSKKQSLKKWEIDLGIKHQEFGLKWDQPVPEDRWNEVAEYCENDVLATEAVFNARHEDFVARQILAKISGLTVNDTSNAHSTRIIFGKDKKPQSRFIYTDLSEIFPGYSYKNGQSWYRGEDPSEGGYVYAEPGVYYDVALLDIASMHPTSIEVLNLFGDKYTKRFSELKQARVAAKHHDLDSAKTLLDGALVPFMSSEDESKQLSAALKIVINSVYGLTSASFDNAFRDPRNVDNIVAKRGALFMIDLKHFVQEQGYTVAHIKTDSVKIPQATPEIIKKVTEFGAKYGYTFEHEETYSKLLLANEAVYIGKRGDSWDAVGKQFQVPFVRKSLFTHEPLERRDFFEAKSVQTALYLDMNEDLDEGEHNYVFVGRTGLFAPVVDGAGGGVLLREEKDGRYSSVSGTKGRRWLEAEVVDRLELDDKIDKSYFLDLAAKALDTIDQYTDSSTFID